MMQSKVLFTTAALACAICHTLKDADAEGAVGPILDEIKPDFARVVKALRNAPAKYAVLEGTLTEDQIIGLARYVSKASGAERPLSEGLFVSGEFIAHAPHRPADSLSIFKPLAVRGGKPFHATGSKYASMPSSDLRYLPSQAVT